MKVCFETFGCRLNRAEALEEEAKYLADGWEVTKSHADAHLIIVRGCSVTARAQRDCEKTIEHLKKKYPHARVIATGCLPAAKTSQTSRTSQTSHTSQTSLSVPTRTARAYLKVQDGCSGACTFCIVPKFRGKAVSIPLADCVEKARRFIEAGYHEIVLTGCNLAQYNDGGKFFPELLAALPDGARYRIGSLEPGAIALKTVDIMASRADICRFLHIPVQTGSQTILTAMRRPYTIRDVDALVDSAITKISNLGLGCDLIAGFPGETEIDHRATIGLLKRLPFTNGHIFPFSSRPGTVASALPQQLDRAVRHGRAHELANLMREKRRAFAKRFLGANVEIVIEDETKMTGWTSEYLTCTIANKNRLPVKRKDLVQVHVSSVEGDRLTAMFI